MQIEPGDEVSPPSVFARLCASLSYKRRALIVVVIIAIIIVIITIATTITIIIFSVASVLE